MAKFRRIPLVFECIQYYGNNVDEIFKWAERQYPHYTCPMWLQPQDSSLIVDTLEGQHIADPGDWIVCGITGEFWPVKPDIFEKTYEPVLAEVDKNQLSFTDTKSIDRAKDQIK